MSAVLGGESGLDFEGLVFACRWAQEEAHAKFEAQRRILSDRRAAALKRGEDGGTAWDAYVADLQPALDARDAAEAEALDALQEAVHSDPLAAWIMLHVSEYHQDEMLVVLEAFPCTLGHLDALAADHGWCREWRVYRREAILTGLVAEQLP